MRKRTLAEKPLLLLLAAVQFTHIMDFMILMPLGPQLVRELGIGPSKFSAIVAAYAVSSGVVGLLTAPFIDRFDRRTALLVVYAGFTVGTLVCGLAQDASALMMGRMISGGFGGVATALVLSIVGDVVPPQRRAAAVGLVMTAFSIASALGVPTGLYIAHAFAWEAPFLMLASLATVMWLVAFFGLPSVSGHLEADPKKRAASFLALLRDANAGKALLFYAALVFGHFVIIPLMAQYFVANMGLPESRVFLVYLIGGVLTVFTAPRIGKLADRFGRVRVLGFLVAVASVITLTISNGGPMPIWLILIIAASFFVFASGRFVPGQAIMTLAVSPTRRGAFMSLSGCARDIASGFASTAGGWIVSADATGRLIGYHWLGWLGVGVSLLAFAMSRTVREADQVMPAKVAVET
ncbi:MFS transporter [Pelagicoccus sp. SDUM812003]|uniref:MFS transporter n=1 Tax=Pelagicoccus sp. SDUM812003 TaxID=3041267 RepID=UPI00280FC1CD|nr:MFS transporter [Pelagicoccus sp. SDUM812003]MDQ8202934.1 MFS transporter [Pelagicoccus sp. SDUM812003]